MSLIIIILVTILFAPCGTEASSRSRAEGLPNIMSSNTVGVGNIWISTQFQSFFQTSVLRANYLQTLVDPSVQASLGESYDFEQDRAKKDLKFVPVISGVIGLTDFMHFEGRTIPWDGTKIGVTSGHLKLTVPNTGKLRMIGAAAVADVILSTEENIVTVQKETPAFDPIFSFSGVIDFDFIKLYPRFPLKTYLNYTNLNDYRIYQLYEQHTLKLGLELKREYNSFYIRWSGTLYKEKKNDINQDPEKGFLSPIHDLGIGYKKRFSKTIPFSLVIDVSGDPVSPTNFLNNELNYSPAIRVGMEWPLFFKETRTEAIRTLIFAELKGDGSPKEASTKSRPLEKMTMQQLIKKEASQESLAQMELEEFLTANEKIEKEKKRKKLIEDLQDK